MGKAGTAGKAKVLNLDVADGKPRPGHAGKVGHYFITQS